MNGDVNVIVTDGFTGNVALKTAEGTANFITNELKKVMTGNFIGKLSSMINIKNINKFKKRLDPRLYNGAIFLGLDSAVVKSHGSTDHIGFANSLSLCEKIVSGNLIDKIKQSIDWCMRINLTKKEIINSLYMQIGFSKKISEDLLEDILDIIVKNLKKYKKLKISNFGTFSVKSKKSRMGRNPKTKEKKIISERNIVSFKPSNDFKDYINSDEKIWWIL